MTLCGLHLLPTSISLRRLLAALHASRFHVLNSLAESLQIDHPSGGCAPPSGSCQKGPALSQVTREAIQAVEQDGIVFIDEIDKIVSSTEHRYGAPSCRITPVAAPCDHEQAICTLLQCYITNVS